MRHIQVPVIALLLVLTASCSSTASQQPEAMYEKAAALTKLSRMVEVAVAYETVPATAVDDELLKAATKHDSSILDLFADYQLKATQGDRHSILVMCDSQGQEALLLDLGCTAKLDEHPWKTAQREQCIAPVNKVDDCH
ncbi:MAG TPA: hypothetical protein VFM75_07095 [Modicisalibacter sp.]|nr:hypothetical protein [Modicisalibacter sp.]